MVEPPYDLEPTCDDAGSRDEVRHVVRSSHVPGRRSRIRVLDVGSGCVVVVHESAAVLYESLSWPHGSETLLASAGGVLWGVPVEGGEPQRLGPVPFPTDTVDGATDVSGVGHGGVILTRVGACRLADGTWIPPRVVLVPSSAGVPDASAARERPSGASPAPAGTATADPHGETWVLFEAESDGPGQGRVQLFRMRPDGTGTEQLTHDECVNRFPQVSPDGRLVAYVSHPPGTEEGTVGADPLLRLCAVDGSGGRDLARLHGVPGTAGGHCWSPDSLRVVCLDRPQAD